jgi:hypothetical protein
MIEVLFMSPELPIAGNFSDTKTNNLVDVGSGPAYSRHLN